MAHISWTALTANTLAASSKWNAWRTALIAQFNGNVDATNLADNAVSAAKHADMSASTATKHSATSSVIADSGSFYTAANVETALAEIAAFTGKTTAAATTGYSSYLINISRDSSTTFSGATGTTQPTCSVTVPANSAPDGIKVEISLFVTGYAAATDFHCPLVVNSTALSSAGSPNYDFELLVGNAVASSFKQPSVIYYLTADGWDGTIENTITIDALYVTTGTAATSSKYTLAVVGLKSRS